MDLFKKKLGICILGVVLFSAVATLANAATAIRVFGPADGAYEYDRVGGGWTQFNPTAGPLSLADGSYRIDYYKAPIDEVAWITVSGGVITSFVSRTWGSWVPNNFWRQLDQTTIIANPTELRVFGPADGEYSYYPAMKRAWSGTWEPFDPTAGNLFLQRDGSYRIDYYKPAAAVDEVAEITLSGGVITSFWSHTWGSLVPNNFWRQLDQTTIIANPTELRVFGPADGGYYYYPGLKVVGSGTWEPFDPTAGPLYLQRDGSYRIDYYNAPIDEVAWITLSNGVITSLFSSQWGIWVQDDFWYLVNENTISCVDCVCDELGAVIDELIPPSSVYKNHGQYVSQVAHLADTLVAAACDLSAEDAEELHSCLVSTRAKTGIGKRVKE